MLWDLTKEKRHALHLRERARERERDTHTHTQKQRERERRTDKERETDRQTERDTHTEGEKERIQMKAKVKYLMVDTCTCCVCRYGSPLLSGVKRCNKRCLKTVHTRMRRWKDSQNTQWNGISAYCWISRLLMCSRDYENGVGSWDTNDHDDDCRPIIARWRFTMMTIAFFTVTPNEQRRLRVMAKLLVLRRVRGESSVHRLSHTPCHVWLRVFRKMKFKCFIIIVPCGKFGLPFLGMSTAAAWAALPIPIGACSIVVCPNKCIIIWLPVSGIFNPLSATSPRAPNVQSLS